MTDNLLENQTLQIILITYTQILQKRRLIFITDLKNIFSEFNDNLYKFFESFLITGGGDIVEKTTQFHDFQLNNSSVNIAECADIAECANDAKFFADLYFKLCCGRHELIFS